MAMVFSNVEVIINLARGVLVGSSVRKPDGNGLKSKGKEGRVSVSIREGRKDIRWSGIGTGEDSFFKDWKDLYITKLMERS